MKRTRHHKKSKRATKRRRTGDYQKGRELVRPRVELKAFDVATQHNNISTAGNFFLCNDVVNGAEIYQRTGRKIYMKSLHIRGFISVAATAVQDVIRMILVYDSQTNTAYPAAADLLLTSIGGGGTDALTGINLNNRARFKILLNETLMVPSVSVAAGVLTNVGFYQQSPTAFNIDHFVKLKGLETEYNGTNGSSIADITSGSLLLFFITYNNNNLYGVTFNTRLRFYD